MYRERERVIVEVDREQRVFISEMEERERLFVLGLKTRIAKERDEDASLAKRWKKKKKTGRKTKKERKNCESYFVVHEFLSMRVYYRKRNTFTMQSFSRFCFWLLVFSLFIIFARKERRIQDGDARWRRACRATRRGSLFFAISFLDF